MEQNIDSLDVSNVKEKKIIHPQVGSKKTFHLKLRTG
jgi:hypothetical protein